MFNNFFSYLCILFLLIGCTSNNNRFYKIKDPSKQLNYTSKNANFTIASQGTKSSSCANKIKMEGGNLIDAAITASLAISVERPHSTGLGGGGFLLYYEAKSQKTHVYDFREMAPRLSHKKMFLDKKGNEIPDLSVTGILASGIPGTIKGLEEIHKAHGKLEWEKLFDCPIEMAEKGFPVYQELNDAIVSEQDRLKKYKGNEIFFNEQGLPLGVGEIFIQKNLADTLKILKAKGAKEFYEGSIAKKIVKTFKKHGGLIDFNDLKKYEVKKREPIIGEYNNHKIISMPPPSSGGIHVAQILNILENLPLEEKNPLSSKNIHLVSSASQMAFADRAKYLGDSDFIHVPVNELTSKKYAKHLAQKIHLKKSLKKSDFPLEEKEFKESTHTVHFSMMDAQNNAIASTQTINGWFGSAVMVEGAGILLNNEMDDFATKVGASNLYGAIGGANNLVQPFKRPLSSMSPTIVLKDNKPFMSVGSPNGTRIITCTMLTILNVLKYNLTLDDAVRLTRYHHQWSPDLIRVDSPGLDKQTELELQKLGHQIKNDPYHCRVQAVYKKNNFIIGVSDPRGEGLSIGH